MTIAYGIALSMDWDRAIVILMTYPDKPLEGGVDSLGWGIARRVPVCIHLDDVPEEIKLRVETTASVVVMTGTSNDASKKKAVAAPRALQ